MNMAHPRPRQLRLDRRGCEHPRGRGHGLGHVPRRAGADRGGRPVVAAGRLDRGHAGLRQPGGDVAGALQAPDLTVLAETEAALFAELGKPNLLTWTPPTGMGRRGVRGGHLLYGAGRHQRPCGHPRGAAHTIRTYDLRLICEAFVRSAKRWSWRRSQHRAPRRRWSTTARRHGLDRDAVYGPIDSPRRWIVGRRWMITAPSASGRVTMPSTRPDVITTPRQRSTW